jgi:hypothetical protein
VPNGTLQKVTIFSSRAFPTLGRSPVRCAEPAGRLLVAGQPVAVAMHPGRVPAELASSDWLVVQSRAPRELGFYSAFAGPRITLSLDGPKADPGHELFHFDTGGGIACAQCHPEGAEDGRVWNFDPIGPRRTQALHVGLAGTEPFHWDGDFQNLRQLINDLFHNRAGVGVPPMDRIARLEAWLGSLRPPPPIVARGTAPAVRGKKLFESDAVGCTKCHAGAEVATSSNQDVGVDSPHAFQVPSLRGVGYRAPLMHNGCARTLRDRFDPACGGGDRHGRTSQLSAPEIDDLIAYLESL